MTHHRFLPLAALAALTLVLAACEITVTGPIWPPTVAGTIDAQTSFPPSAQVGGDLAPGATRYYTLDVDAGRDLVYAAIQGDTGLTVSLFTASGNRIAVSNSPTYFVGSVAALQAQAEAVGGASISLELACPGPCVATPVAASSYVVAVSNPTGSTRSFDLFAFTIDETDENELNDSVASPTPLNGAGNYEGAIEVLGDVDHFQYNAPLGVEEFFVVFQPFDQALGLELEILDCAACEVLDGTIGFRVEGLLDGDILRVRSTTGRAGPSVASGYSLQVTTTPPAGASVTSR